MSTLLPGALPLPCWWCARAVAEPTGWCAHCETWTRPDRPGYAQATEAAYRAPGDDTRYWVIAVVDHAQEYAPTP